MTSEINEPQQNPAAQNEDLTGQVGSTFAEFVGLADRPVLVRGWGLNAWTANVVCSALVLAVSLCVEVLSAKYGFGTSAKPGAGFFPAIVAALGVLIGAIWLFQTQTQRVLAESKPSAPDAEGVKRIVVTIIVFLGFGELAEPLGFVIAAAASLAVLLRTTARTSYWLAAVISVCFSVTIYLSFQRFLGIELPKSHIPFLGNLGL
jgi:putative tricarboxylic transport membrane protein